MGGDLENYRPVSLTSISGKVMENTILGFTERQLKTKGIIRHSQHMFTKGNFCLSTLIYFYKIICLVDKRKVMDVIHL